MNLAFGSDVFHLYAEIKNQYVKIRCGIVGCTFDLWMNYEVGLNEEITNLRMFRFIIQGHDPGLHLEHYDAQRKF